jgi:hypothetical protein
MLQSSPRSMMTPITARSAYTARSGAQGPERWSRRRTLAFIVVTNGTIWGMIAWSLAAMMNR